MKSLITIAALLLTTKAFATDVMFYCQGVDNKFIHASITAASQEAAEAAVLKLMQEADMKVTKVACELPPKILALADLGGKRWGFQGMVNDATYLVFEGKHMLDIQECGSEKIIHDFTFEIIDDNTFTITDLKFIGNEEACNPMWVPGFQIGSRVHIQGVQRVGQRAGILVEDRRPTHETASTSLYKEMK
jgi:hypothetical protein